MYIDLLISKIFCINILGHSNKINAKVKIKNFINIIYLYTLYLPFIK